MFGKQNKNKAQRMKKKECHLIDLTQAPYTSFGTGIVRGNPKRCLNCRKLIRNGQPWTKHVSANDPRYGRYSIIFHSGCDEANNHK